MQWIASISLKTFNLEQLAAAYHSLFVSYLEWQRERASLNGEAETESMRPYSKRTFYTHTPIGIGTHSLLDSWLYCIFIPLVMLSCRWGGREAWSLHMYVCDLPLSTQTYVYRQITSVCPSFTSSITAPASPPLRYGDPYILFNTHVDRQIRA